MEVRREPATDPKTDTPTLVACCSRRRAGDRLYCLPPADQQGENQ
jgi:hypothetical protein